MKIAVTSQGKDLDFQVDPLFGRAAYILIVDSETLNFEALDNKENVVELRQPEHVSETHDTSDFGVY